MKAILNIIFIRKFFFLILVFLFVVTVSFGSVFVSAQENSNRISLAVTPPLFQVSVEPGSRWVSSVKMVNREKNDIEIYATPVNFKAQGEDGSARFIPIVEGGSGGIMSAEWIDVSKGPYTVPAEGSVDIPFTISVPQDATPGGHYIALLIGTEPADEKIEGSVVRVSSLVTSLILLRVDGDVVESGFIREFRTDAGWYNRPEARFTVNFQNTGTVHLQPRGVIEIYNMWGTKRGSIPINTANQFGNVLPESSRSFSFRWESEGSIFEAGKYTANVTLAYGTDGSRHTSETITFWVLPLVPLLSVLGALLVLLLIVIGSIRLYVKKVMEYERKRLEVDAGNLSRIVSTKSLRAPIHDGVINMRRDLAESVKKPLWEAVKDMLVRYKMLVFTIFILVFLALAFYITSKVGLDSDKGFRIFEERPVSENETLP